MKYVLGLDGGGSKVVCLAANESGELLGCGRGGPVNTNYVLYNQARDSAIDAIQNALKSAGLRADQVAAFVFSAPLDPATLSDVIQACQLKDPVRAAEGETSRWAARFWIDQRIGVTVDAGTGSLSRGWTRDGRESGAGGFGATLDDKGSGVWISLKAMSAALQAYDGRAAQTGLTEALLTHFGLPHIQDLPFRVSGGFLTTAKMIENMEAPQRVRFTIDSGHILQATPAGEVEGDVTGKEDSGGGLFFRQFESVEPLTRHEVASFCPIVAQIAEAGDLVARQILESAGIGLGRLAAAVITRLRMEDENFAVVPFGGVFKVGELVLKPFSEFCCAVAPQAVIALPKFEPEVGAVLIALEKIKGAIDSQTLKTIERSSSNFPSSQGTGAKLDG
jgi:N-acetylglucosamine kinase-like BadF-type ATPase